MRGKSAIAKNGPVSTDFQIRPLSTTPFRHLFALSDEELAAVNAVRFTVDSCPGYPCRVSLRDRPVGEEVLLVNFAHQSGNSPYQGSGAIFIGGSAEPAVLAPNEIPPFLRNRPLSVRAYDKRHMMVAAEVTKGECLNDQLRAFFELREVAYQHVHFARQGCFACLVERAV